MEGQIFVDCCPKKRFSRFSLVEHVGKAGAISVHALEAFLTTCVPLLCWVLPPKSDKSDNHMPSELRAPASCHCPIRLPPLRCVFHISPASSAKTLSTTWHFENQKVIARETKNIPYVDTIEEPKLIKAKVWKPCPLNSQEKSDRAKRYVFSIQSESTLSTRLTASLPTSVLMMRLMMGWEAPSTSPKMLPMALWLNFVLVPPPRHTDWSISRHVWFTMCVCSSIW